MSYYDRNLGKGYAVKTGAREARGQWVAYVDCDLDLDPAALPESWRSPERDGLDFAIGSKRHPDSKVHYPRSRVATSGCPSGSSGCCSSSTSGTRRWAEGLSSRGGEKVVPLLLVKRYAFDIELLAVSRAFGYGRVRELPMTLDYRFTGSGVRSPAALHAVVDTLAMFYRLRILGHYQRKRGSRARTAGRAPRLRAARLGRDAGRRRGSPISTIRTSR